MNHSRFIWIRVLVLVGLAAPIACQKSGYVPYTPGTVEASGTPWSDYDLSYESGRCVSSAMESSDGSDDFRLHAQKQCRCLYEEVSKSVSHSAYQYNAEYYLRRVLETTAGRACLKL